MTFEKVFNWVILGNNLNTTGKAEILNVFPSQMKNILFCAQPFENLSKRLSFIHLEQKRNQLYSSSDIEHKGIYTCGILFLK